MTRERFQDLALAYGGDLARWPAEARGAAQALLRADAGWAEAVLADAARFDAVLAQSPAPASSADLVGRILAAAPRARRRLAWLLPAGLGVGLAAACAAGMVLGAQLSRWVVEDQAVTTAIAEDSLYADEAA